jgi:hypothetical protein
MITKDMPPGVGRNRFMSSWASSEFDVVRRARDIISMVNVGFTRPLLVFL